MAVRRVDVCIVGSGFGGSISAFRLAELYRAAGQPASILVLERGERHRHTDFRQSMDIEHLSRVYGLIQGLGARSKVDAPTATWPKSQEYLERARAQGAAIYSLLISRPFQRPTSSLPSHVSPRPQQARLRPARCFVARARRGWRARAWRAGVPRAGAASPHASGCA